ncbi:MAG: SDR family oxidoreductase [Acidobacteriales bacterium]|nr:SDR family oxidoreductase [Terriglobales bacterium]
MTKVLAEQVAVVTGGGRGIGAAIARRLAENGATVIVAGRTGSALKMTVDAIQGASGKAEAVICDVAHRGSVEKLANHVMGRHKKIDILVNNAGVGSFTSPLHQLPPEEWERVLNINLKGIYHTIRSFAPAMIAARSGHIINISSLAGKNALANGAVYAASKWGLNGLTYSVAEELRGFGIRVAAVCPGSVDTELSPHVGKDKSRMLQPEDVAHAVLALVTQAPQSFISEVLLRPTQKP